MTSSRDEGTTSGRDEGTTSGRDEGTTSGGGTASGRAAHDDARAATSANEATSERRGICRLTIERDARLVTAA